MESTAPNAAGISRQSRPATERRHTVRHRTHSPAYASLNGPTDGIGPDLSEILDISSDGMSIQTSSPLQVEHNLSLCLDLSETGARIRTTGQVVWSDTSGRAGIRFAELSGQSLDQLQEWLFVNVLTACDHARTTPPQEDAWDDASNTLLSSHTMPKEEEVASGTAAISAEGSGPAMSEAARGGNIADVEPNRSDRETTLQLLAERALSLTRATGAAIALSEGNDHEMICVASAGSDAPPFGMRLQVGSGFSGECVRTGRSLRCDDSETDDRVDRQGCKALGIRAMVAVPIRPGNKVAGLLEVFSPQPYAFNANDISVLQQLTGSIVSTMRHSAEAPSASELPVETATPARPPRIETRPAEIAAVRPERHAAAARPSTQPSLHKILLVAAIGTFVFAVLWLIAPWVSKTMGSSSRTAPHAQSPQAQVSRSPDLPDNVTDLASLRKVAEGGDPAAQFALGARYATGEEVKQDYTEAVRWFTLAAGQGHILAQATLGAYYWAGRGVPQDLTKAYYWSVLAQAGGDQASKYRVAVLASRMSRSQVLAAQEQANEWLRNFSSQPRSTP
ncbi:MAG: GAF domain-containing protein [Terriglobales bacterium]